MCLCSSPELSSDLLEWDGEKWLGAIVDDLKKKPPEGCNVRAVWMGSDNWTGNGEAFAMQLSKPLVEGETYSFTFTYTKDGHYSDTAPFSPIVYTDNYIPSLYTAYKIGRLPSTNDWVTNTFSFTADRQQNGHSWLILRALESSGLILSNCIVDNPIEEDLLLGDTTLCTGGSLELLADEGTNYTYEWSTGETTRNITISESGVYAVRVQYYLCSSTDSVTVNFEDCEPMLLMPNVFTPNGDSHNEYFLPMDFNYIDSGQLVIFNRWGQQVFTGDLFTGWNGKIRDTEASPGVYFYEIYYISKQRKRLGAKGIVTLSGD